MHKNGFTKKNMTLTEMKREQAKEDELTKKKEKRKSNTRVHKMRCRLPSTDSKQGKASDSNGIRAEDIKACDETTKEMTRQIFDEVLKQEDCTPTTWRRIRMKVIHKEEVEEAGNYRPI